ncbi:MAG TPA: hypothetical protein VH575_23980 [Gemmataceae bacterium]
MSRFLLLLQQLGLRRRALPGLGDQTIGIADLHSAIGCATAPMGFLTGTTV